MTEVKNGSSSFFFFLLLLFIQCEKFPQLSIVINYCGGESWRMFFFFFFFFFGWGTFFFLRDICWLFDLTGLIWCEVTLRVVTYLWCYAFFLTRMRLFFPYDQCILLNLFKFCTKKKLFKVFKLTVTDFK